jgi:uncharacterized protein
MKHGSHSPNWHSIIQKTETHINMSYELKKDAGGKYRFNLKATNGQVILSSQGYLQKESALDGIESVRKNGTDEKNFEKKTSSANEPYFVLKALNHQVIGQSEMYSSIAARDNGIASVQKNCTSTSLDDLT